MRARREEWAEKFYELMTSLDFMPNSPTLMNAGRELQQLAACFVLPVEDSMEQIFDSIKYAALIIKAAAVTGFFLFATAPQERHRAVHGRRRQRPCVLHEGLQRRHRGGQTGRHAPRRQYGYIARRSPRHSQFYQSAKEDNEELTNFNISVALTEEFMEAVKADREYHLINPRTGQAESSLEAQKYLTKSSTLPNGEPGIIFLDRINKDNPTPQLGEIESTNPCGEQPLLPYGSLQLGFDKYYALRQGRWYRLPAFGAGHPRGGAIPGQRHRYEPITRCPR